MFESRLLDRFTRVHPAVPVLIYGPVVLVLLYLAVHRDGWWDTLALVPIGYLVWTLFEYWLHRLVFHFEPEAGVGARLHWMIHGVHHDHPNDPMRLVMPPAVSLPLATGIFFVFYFAAGRGYGPSLSAGFFAGYLIYDMTHYYLHHFSPHGRVARVLRERHMRHHFQDDTKGFGISAPYWDEVFRTSPRSRRSSQ